MKKKIFNILSTFSMFFIFESKAIAQQNGGIGSPTSPPIGYVQFCRDNAKDCNTKTLPSTSIPLTDQSWKLINHINSNVNQEIIPVTDQEHWGVAEIWSYPTDGKGDCEDYVLEKRKRLILAGFAEQTLLITVVRDRIGDGHAVLTIKTDRGDFILDNQEAKILAWRDTGYRFIKRQSDEKPTHWISLGGIDTANVASSR